MEFRFVAPSLPNLDSLKTELLCLPVFADERPWRGAAGLADWRLCGRLSALILRERITGAKGEALLMPPPEQRLAAERLLFVGLGARADVGADEWRRHVRKLVKRVLAMRVRTVAIALPHESLSWLTPEQAIDVLLEESGGVDDRIDELVLIETPESQRRMEPRIERMRRRASLDV